MNYHNNTHRAAHYYAVKHGFSVIPLREHSKEPKLRAWKAYQQHRPTEATIDKWFLPPANIAIVMGDVSGGLICRDFDVMEAYYAWERNFPQWAKKLPTVSTGRGKHVYAKIDFPTMRQHSAFNKQIFTFDDGELRCGGYCVAPPSVHPSGEIYNWGGKLTESFPLVNPFECGFLGSSKPCDREDVEHRENLEHPEDIENTRELITEDIIKSELVTPQTLQLDPETQAQVTLAIQRTLPNAGGTSHRMIFELARELQAIEVLADVEPLALESILRAWHAQALPFITTKPFEETLFDFLEGWDKVEHPAGKGHLAMLFQQALQEPLPSVAEQFEQTALRLLVALCQQLQIAADKEPFFISARTAGRLLKVDHATSARWLKLLCHLKILKLAEKGNRESRKASRYYYLR